MPDPGTAVIVGGTLYGSQQAKKGSQAMAGSAEAGIAETARQFDITQQALEPYRQIGTGGLNILASQLGVPQYRPAPEAPQKPIMPKLVKPLYDVSTTQIDSQINRLREDARSAEGYDRLVINQQIGQLEQQKGDLLAQQEEYTGSKAKYDKQMAKYRKDLKAYNKEQKAYQNQLVQKPTARPGAGAAQVGQTNILAGQTLPEFQYGGQIPQFQAGGEAALPEFATNVGQAEPFQFSFDEYQQSPAYRAIMDEALAATEARAAAQGMRGSGNVLAELAKVGGTTAAKLYGEEFGRQAQQAQMNEAMRQSQFGRDVTKFGLGYQRAGDVYNRALREYGIGREREQEQYGRTLGKYGLDVARQQDVYGKGQDFLNRLSAIAGVGQTAAAQQGQFGSAASSNIANLLGQAGAARAQGYTGMAGELQSGIGQVLGYQQQQAMNNMLSSYLSKQQPQQYSQYGPYQSGYKYPTTQYGYSLQ